MHLVQPSTPMAARAAGGLCGAGRSWAVGCGAWGPGEQPGAETRAGGVRKQRAPGDEWCGKPDWDT